MKNGGKILYTLKILETNQIPFAKNNTNVYNMAIGNKKNR